MIISPEEATVLYNSDAFQRLIQGAQAHVMNYVHLNDKEATLESGCRSHDKRCGAEVALNFLTTQPTTKDVARQKKKQDAESITYGT